jgi:hypothetical protein
MLLYVKFGCYTVRSCQAAGRPVFAFFVSFGCIRRGQLRESPKSLPRFSGEDLVDLSSVMLPQDLQLNPKPQMFLPTRLSVEPLALRLVRFQEAPEEHKCRFFCPLSQRTPWQAPVVFFGIGSERFTVVLLLGVHLGTSFISVFQSLSCMSFVVSVCHL